ncbi:uncharacterized protein LOC143053510 [Mytilus galloprovincialis]|uniref:uncharacterized protein LOC143053510 n=1 Tax=Mytilus galloprovincialis TaxID=29158 RepID=UPI003F7C0F38
MVFLNVLFLFLSMLMISDAVFSDSEDETEKGQVLKTYSRLNPTVNAVFSPTNFDQNDDSSFDSDVSNDYLGISLNISSRSQILGRSLETQIESSPFFSVCWTYT